MSDASESPYSTGNPETTALVIAAHPDDGDFGCAGYVSQLAAKGWDVHFLVCTNGAKGTEDRTMTRERLIALRQEEQREACRRMGARGVFCLGHEDGELVYTRPFLGELVRSIRQLRPHTVLTHDPTDIIILDSFINHPDHRAAGTAALDAVYPTARDHLSFPEHLAEGLEPHKVREILLWNSNHPNFDVDITADLETKIHALSAHATQFASKQEFVEFARESWKSADGRYLERFRRLTMAF